MEAKELRIGNMVILNNTKYRPTDSGKIHVVDQIKNETVNIFRLDKLPYSECYGQFIQYIEPIPLTDSFFQKLNAEKDKEYNAHYVLPINGDYGYMLFTKDESGYSVFIHIDDSSILLYHNIMYVHEIQNIYFAISGEELTIKP